MIIESDLEMTTFYRIRLVLFLILFIESSWFPLHGQNKDSTISKDSINFHNVFHSISNKRFDSILEENQEYLEQFAHCSDFWILKNFLKKENIYYNFNFKNGVSPFSIACSCDDVEFIEQALKENTHLINEKLLHGNTCLILAVQNYSIKNVKYLVSQGANLFLENDKEENVFTFSYSPRSHFPEIAKELISVKTVNYIPDKLIVELIENAIVFNDKILFQILLDEFVSRERMDSLINSSNIVKIAIMSLDDYIIKKILPLIDVSTEYNGYSLVGTAINRLSNEYQYEGIGNVFSDSTTYYEKFKVLTSLKNFGSDINNWGSDSESLIPFVLDMPYLIKFLVDIGYDINTIRGENGTVLDHAIIQLFEQKGFVLNGKDFPFNNEIEEIQVEIQLIEFLIKLGASNSREKLSVWEYLMFEATKKENLKVLNEIIKKGVNINVHDIHNKRVLYYAKKTKNIAIISYLKERGAKE